MSEQTFDPRAFVLRKDIHPVELWSPGARVRIRVPAVPVAGTIIAGALGALAGGAVVGVFAFSAKVPEQAQWAATIIAAAAGAIWAARKFHEMFEEHDVTFDWTAERATFRHGSSLRSVALAEIAGFMLRGLKTRHEPGEVGGPVPSYTVYWCRLEAELPDGPALVLEGDNERDPVSARRGIEAMGRELARAVGKDLRFEDFREMSAKEYFL
jgi:hypothetical protein